MLKMLKFLCLTLYIPKYFQHGETKQMSFASGRYSIEKLLSNFLNLDLVAIYIEKRKQKIKR